MYGVLCEQLDVHDLRVYGGALTEAEIEMLPHAALQFDRGTD
jgi:hypothetical protein